MVLWYWQLNLYDICIPQKKPIWTTVIVYITTVCLVRKSAEELVLWSHGDVVTSWTQVLSISKKKKKVSDPQAAHVTPAGRER